MVTDLGGVAADEPAALPARELFHTTDPGEAETAMLDMLGEHHLSLRDAASEFEAIVRHADLADLRIAHLHYGAALDITAGALGRYAINFTLAGESRVRHGAHTAAALPGAGTIFSPLEESALSWSPDFEVLCLVIPERALRQHFRKLTGSEAIVSFDPGIDVGAARLARSVLLSMLRLTRGGTDDIPEALTWEMRNALLTALLTELSHDQTAALTHGPQRPPAITAEAAAGAMRRQLSQPPSIPHLAAQVGVSTRTLQSVFHERFATTPTAYFRDLRLEAVREALVAASAKDTTVSRVAAEIGGFFHLGRFAGDYRDRFGEHPVDTLRDGRAGNS